LAPSAPRVSPATLQMRFVTGKARMSRCTVTYKIPPSATQSLSDLRCGIL
jgi:hypothetical protein